MNQEITPEYASISKIAIQFGISRNTIYRAIKAEKIRAIKIGRATRLSVPSVRAFFENAPAAEVKGKYA